MSAPRNQAVLPCVDGGTNWGTTVAVVARLLRTISDGLHARAARRVADQRALRLLRDEAVSESHDIASDVATDLMAGIRCDR